MKRWPQIVVHADMDAFYAAVEQLDNPNLRGKPVLVGSRNKRGVVLTASYEARPYRVGSAMAVVEALRRCPDAIMVEPNFARYQEISEQIMNIFDDFSPHVETLSLDEAFLDMTGAEHFFGAPDAMGKKIKAAVLDATGLRISVGVSETKYVAKVASAHDKPDGLTVVPQEYATEWLAPLSITRLWGVGKKTASRLFDLGFNTIGDIAAADERFLVDRLGSVGSRFYQLAYARDPRPVLRGRAAKSIGSDRTLSKDVSARKDIEGHLRRAAEKIARRIRAKDCTAGGIRVRLKTKKFEMLTRQRQLSKPVDTAESFLHIAKQLLDEFDHPGPFRLVGMAAFNLHWCDEPLQTDLFDDPSTRKLETTVDDLIDRFGSDLVVRASDINHPGKVSKNGVNLDFLDYRDGERVSTPEHPD